MLSSVLFVTFSLLCHLSQAQESVTNLCFAKAFPTATTRLSCAGGLVIALGRAEFGRGEGGSCHGNTDTTSPSSASASLAAAATGDCRQATNVSATCCGLSECHLTVTKVTLTSCSQPATFLTLRYDCVPGDRVDCRQGEGHGERPLANEGQIKVKNGEEAWPPYVAMIQSQVSSSHIIIGDLDLNMQPHMPPSSPPAVMHGSSTPSTDMLYPSLSPPLAPLAPLDPESSSRPPPSATLNTTSHVTIDVATAVSTVSASSHSKFMSDVTTFVPLVTSVALLLVAFFVAGRLVAKRRSSSCPCYLLLNYCTKLSPFQSCDTQTTPPSSALVTRPPDVVVLPMTDSSSSMTSFDFSVNVSKAMSQPDGTSLVRMTSCRQSTNFQTLLLGNAPPGAGGKCASSADDDVMTSKSCLSPTPLLLLAPPTGAPPQGSSKPPVPKKTFAPFALSLPPCDSTDKYTAENASNSNKDLHTNSSNTPEAYACTPLCIRDSDLV